MPNHDDKTNYLGVPTSTNRYMLQGSGDNIRESPNELLVQLYWTPNLQYPGKKSKKNVNFQDGSRDDSSNFKTEKIENRTGLIDHVSQTNFH